MKTDLKRWLAPLLAGGAWIGAMLMMTWLYLLHELSGGFSGLFKAGLTTPVVKTFLLKSLISEVLPVHLAIALLMWLALLLSIMALSPARTSLQAWTKHWNSLEGFWGTFAMLGALHLGLWWQVPSTLWVLIGLNRLPFWALFPLLTVLLIGPFAWICIKGHGIFHGGATLMLACALGFGVSYLPLTLQPTWKPSNTGNQEARLLMVAVDGLRKDTAEKGGLHRLEGLHVPDVHTPIPATRMLYSLLWGGDAMRYTSSLAIPDIEEVFGKVRYSLLDEWKDKGLKARFYIDDAGTIGLTGRDTGLDEVGMPAPGWESFLDSNFGAHMPLYAALLNRVRQFPGTNPWAGHTEGLISALERGRGAHWVMYHSCLMHQPIFLNRKELQSLGRWWTLTPRQLRPIGGWPAMEPGLEQRWDKRQDPFKTYELRTQSLMDAWIPILNSLKEDKDYQSAMRVFFSDHGEHFFRLVGDVRIIGIHGFYLDPQELRVPFVISGPGAITPNSGALAEGPRSSLILKTAVREAMASPHQLFERFKAALEPQEKLYFRMTMQDISKFIPLQMEFKVTSFSDYMKDTLFGPGGRWGIAFNKSIEERKTDFCVAILDKQGLLTAYRPLKAGGAQKLIYAKDTLVSESIVTEEEYQEKQREVVENIKKGPLWR